MNRLYRALASATIVAGVLAHGAALAASPEKGKVAFIKNGCWQCHGFEGQGGVAGKTLAPDTLPVEAFTAFVRTTNRAMPPYSEAVLSDADLADIHAYLAAIPKGPDAKSIPLLSQ
jgi:mono/diheme cytochrome c family protein